MWNYVITDLKKRIMGGVDTMDGESFPGIEMVRVDGFLLLFFFSSKEYTINGTLH